MSNGNDLKRTRVQFTYPKCMINDEEEMRRKRKTRKEDEKRKKCLKIKSTINFTLMKKVSTFSAIMANQQINYDFTLTFF